MIAMGYMTRHYTKASQRPACAKCGTFEAAPNETICEFCADIRQQEATAFRRGDPEQKVGL